MKSRKDLYPTKEDIYQILIATHESTQTRLEKYLDKINIDLNMMKEGRDTIQLPLNAAQK